MNTILWIIHIFLHIIYILCIIRFLVNAQKSAAYTSHRLFFKIIKFPSIPSVSSSEQFFHSQGGGCHSRVSGGAVVGLAKRTSWLGVILETRLSGRYKRRVKHTGGMLSLQIDVAACGEGDWCTRGILAAILSMEQNRRDWIPRIQISC